MIALRLLGRLAPHLVCIVESHLAVDARRALLLSFDERGPSQGDSTNSTMAALRLAFLVAETDVNTRTTSVAVRPGPLRRFASPRGE